MEKDDEMKGSGNSYDFGARIYDPRVGRFFSVDPFGNMYPNESKYLFGGNNPIKLIDYQGLYKIDPTFRKNYPMVTKYIEKQLRTDLNNSVFLKALVKEFGEFTESEILEAINSDSGPVLIGVDNPGEVYFASTDDFSGGSYSGSDGPYGSPTIELNNALLQQYKDIMANSESTDEDKQAALLAVVGVLLHETVHYGDMQDGVDSGPLPENIRTRKDKNGLPYVITDRGAQFELKAYYDIIGEDATSAEDYLNDSKDVIDKCTNVYRNKEKDLPTVVE